MSIVKNKSVNTFSPSVLYYTYKNLFFSICLKFAIDHAEAEDMLQEGFMKIFENMEKYDSSKDFSPWACTIIKNNCIDILRRRKLLTDIPEQLKNSMVSKFTEGLDNLQLSDLLRSINKIPEGYRNIFILHEIEGYSHIEISRKLKISLGTSKSQLSRSKNFIIKNLEI